MTATQVSKNKELRLARPDESFIPFACHYSPSTIINKNGELLQIIKLVGLTSQNLEKHNIDLREIIRKAIKENAKNEKFAFWIHTVRRKRNLEPNDQYENYFSNELNEAWCKKNYWRDKFVNELYISILYQGKPLKINNFAEFLKSLSFKLYKKGHEIALQESYSNLNRITDKLLEILADYGAKRLTIFQNETGVYSEPLAFLGKIIHLQDLKMKLPLVDLAKYVISSKVAFGNNSIEVLNKNEKHFAAIITIKEYKDVSSKILDNFLQLSNQFVITQTFDFTVSKNVMNDYKRQNYLLELSDDKEFVEATNLNEIVNIPENSTTDFGNSQISIMVISDNLDKLDYEVRKSSEELAKLGILCVREDINLEATFWAQLPGNFAFLKREKPLLLDKIGGFASLHNYPAGKLSSIWGNALTLLRTAKGTPYFFNFHIGDKGNTAIIGPTYSGTTVLCNFLLSYSMKFDPEIIHVDSSGDSELLIKAIGGKVLNIGSKQSELKLNPFLLDENQQNKEFLRSYIKLIAGNLLLSEQSYNLIIEKLFKITKSDRNLLNLVAELKEVKNDLEIEHFTNYLADWVAKNKSYIELLENNQDNLFSIDYSILSFNLKELYNDKLLCNLVSVYLMHYISYRLSKQDQGTRAITIIDKITDLLLDNNNSFVTNWFKEFDKQNKILVTLFDPAHEALISNILTKESFEELFINKIYLANNEPGQIYNQLLGLNNKEKQLIKSLRLINRIFILKQAEETTLLELSIAGLDNFLKVLSANPKTIDLANRIINDVGGNPQDWLPKLYEDNV